MAGMVIVGAGECGARAALTLRDAGYDGPVVLLGAERETPYERPPLTKPAGDGPVQPKPVAGAERLAATGIDFRPGVEVRGIDRAARRVRLSDGGTLGYDRLLLATGARPRTLPALAEVGRTFRTLADARRLYDGAARRVAIVGAGLIGLELAAVLRGRGHEVTVIEAADRALGRAVLPDLAAALVERHRSEGVALHFGAGIVGAEAGAILLADGRRLPADAVVVAIGVAPETALAETAGLPVENGVAVDECLRTADPAIFAAGDCAALLHPRYGRRMRFESWRNARDQGEAAARNMLGAAAPFRRVPWFWSDQYDLGLQVAGLPDAALPRLERRLGPDARIVFTLEADGRLASASGLGPGTAVGRDVRLAEMLIEAGARPDPAALADPEVSLKKLVRGQ